MPFTFLRPLASIRSGMLKMHEKWERMLPQANTSFLVPEYLQKLFPASYAQEQWYIHGGLYPTPELATHLAEMPAESALLYQNQVLVARTSAELPDLQAIDDVINKVKNYEIKKEPSILRHKWDIFLNNPAQIKADFTLLTKGRSSTPVTDPYTKIYQPENLFIEEGALVQAAVINASGGPVYIGRNAEVQEGSLVRGPFAMLEHSVLNMGTKIRGNVTLGPWCKAGGEVSGSVFFGYSNKAHDGYLGNSVIAEWCNLGADTNSSNLKNNYSEVKVWNYRTGSMEASGQQFCGLMMGDHTRCSINTMFNTGTVTGISANIFGSGFPPKFVPSFAWGGSEGFETAELEKMIAVASRACQRRDKVFSEEEQSVFRYIFAETAVDRARQKNAT